MSEDPYPQSLREWACLSCWFLKQTSRLLNRINTSSAFRSTLLGVLRAWAPCTMVALRPSLECDRCITGLRRDIWHENLRDQKTQVCWCRWRFRIFIAWHGYCPFGIESLRTLCISHQSQATEGCGCSIIRSWLCRGNIQAQAGWSWAHSCQYCRKSTYDSAERSCWVGWWQQLLFHEWPWAKTGHRRFLGWVPLLLMSLFKQWRKIGLLFKHKASSVVYCDVKEGCKYAIQNMFSNNGIARAPNGTFMSFIRCLVVFQSLRSNPTIPWSLLITFSLVRWSSEPPLERWIWCPLMPSQIIRWTISQLIQKATSGPQVTSPVILVPWLEILTGSTAIPHLVGLMRNFLDSPNTLMPSLALRFSINTGPDAFYGEKYKVTKVCYKSSGLPNIP